MAWGKQFYEGNRPDYVPEGDWAIVRELCWPYNINPYFIAAIGWHETHWGQLGAGRNGFHLGVSVYPPHYGLDSLRGVKAQVAWAAKRVNLYLAGDVTRDAVIAFCAAVDWTPNAQSWGTAVYLEFNRLCNAHATGPGSPCPYGPTPEQIGGAIGEAIGGLFGGPTEPAPTGSGGVIGWIGRNVMAPLGALFGGAADTLRHVFFFIRWAFDRIVWVFREAWGFMHKLTTWMADRVSWIFTECWSGVHWLFSTAWGGVHWLFTRAWEWLRWLFDTARGLVDFLWHKARDAIVWFFGTVWNGVYWLFTKAWAAVQWLFDRLWPAIYHFFTYFWTAAAWFFGTMWNGAYWLFSTAWAAVQWLFDRLWPAIYHFFTYFWEAAAWLFGRVWELVFAFFSNPIKFLATVLTTVIKLVLAPVLWLLIQGLELIGGSWQPPACVDYMERVKGGK